MFRILIFANGELPNLEAARHLLQEDDFIICADGGTRHALALGLTPNIIIGDMDSVPAGFQPSMQTQILQFSPDKNETDLELAIAHATALAPQQIMIVAALGGRLDQTLGNISLLAHQHASFIVLDDGVEEIFFCNEQVQIKGRSGDLVSLIPWSGDVTGVVTKNLKWPLVNEVLYSNKTRGISNEMSGEEASVKIVSGLLLVIHRRSGLNS